MIRRPPRSTHRHSSAASDVYKRQIITSANKTLEGEITKTREALRKDVSEIIISTTEKILEEEISKDKHEKIIIEAAKKI